MATSVFEPAMKAVMPLQLRGILGNYHARVNPVPEIGCINETASCPYGSVREPPEHGQHPVEKPEGLGRV
jgi:hypothetical protein